MKRLMGIILIGVMLLGLSGCGQKGPLVLPPAPQPDPAGSQAQ